MSYSSRRCETSGTVRGGSPFGSTVFFGLEQSTPHTLGVEVLGIDWRAGLLPPGLIQTSGFDAIKAKFIHELEDDGLGGRFVTGNRQGDAAGRAFWPIQLPKVSGVDVVERLDYMPGQLLRHPLAFR